MLTTCSIFAFLHIKCFTYKVYVPDACTIEGDLRDHRTPRLKSLGHAMNPMETFRELRAGEGRRQTSRPGGWLLIRGCLGIQDRGFRAMVLLRLSLLSTATKRKSGKGEVRAP
jgi:hypothetical protein